MEKQEIQQTQDYNHHVAVNSFPFDTEISQDVLNQDKNAHQFTPWIGKKTTPKLIISDHTKPNHSFLSKLKLSSKFPRVQTPAENQGKHQYITWLKRDLKHKINQEKIVNSHVDSKNDGTKFVEHRNNLYKRSKAMKLYHKPKSIQLSLQNFPNEQLRQTIYLAPSSMSERKKKKQYNSISSKKDKKSISYHSQLSNQGFSTNILNTQRKFYKTLELKLSRDFQQPNSPKNKEKKLSLGTCVAKNQKTSNCSPINQISKRNNIYHRSTLGTSHGGNLQRNLACQGKNVLTSEFQSRREKMRMLYARKQFTDNIFLQ